MDNTSSVTERLLGWLHAAEVSFRVVHHEPTLTSADSARARGEPLLAGAKALVVRADGEFRLLVIPADRQLDSREAKKSLKVRDLRFATAEELQATVGLPPGSIPPFGPPVLNLPLYADFEVGGRHPNVAFNAGSLTVSVVMPAEAWARLAQPQRMRLAKS